MKGILEGILEIFISSVVFIFFVLAFIGTLYWGGDYTCKVKAEAQSMQYKFGPIMGCMVKYKGQWVDYDRLRYTGEE